MPQIHYPTGPYYFITVTYQSNDYLNEKVDNIKTEIAKIIFTAAPVKSLQSHIHGQIIAEVPTDNAVRYLKQIVEALKEPLAKNTPKLDFTAELVSHGSITNNTQHWIYVNENNNMNENFLKSISSFYPKKED